MTKEEEAIKWLEEELRIWESECKSKHGVKDALKMAIKALERESKTGHWTDDGYCSCCNKQTLPLDISGYASGYDSFCPNCGAKMVEPQGSEDKE